ncbi:uncharacterized protein LOC111604735 [Drosophila hydei]|uniref:Uncharacterized protein LOC111604735 n=1 Tax=Drosophila hydei TaxID=7224 RepID=A0A6J1MD74_DROHY|nr:uncharacterized protein LOC111604735 [Drosophila hydei]
MSDSQRQVKMVAEQALASLVERAKRLQLNSVSSLQLNIDDEEQRAHLKEIGAELSVPAAIGGNVKKSTKNSPTGAVAGTQRALAATVRKQRKIDAEPSPPPPPSPRELGVIAELRDEYNQTDQLLDQMLTDATNLNRDMICCSQHQRDLSLVQQIELETTTRSLDSLFGALSADLGRNDLRDAMQRCDTALERTKQRLCNELINEQTDSHSDPNSDTQSNHSNDNNSDEINFNDNNFCDNNFSDSNKITVFEAITEAMEMPGVVGKEPLIEPIEPREPTLGDCDGSSLLAKRD